MQQRLLRILGMALAGLFLFGLLAAVIRGPMAGNSSSLGIAVVEVKGQIVHSQSGRAFGGISASADTIMQQIRAAAKDQRVKGLLLHINSPGGSAPATEEVYTEILRFKEKTGKPVLAVMADVAASGGYYIAAGADEIYANPATMTGSIGVVIRFENYAGLYSKYGVKIETIKSGKYKDIGNPARPMTQEERDLLQKMVNQIYEGFLNAVIKGRNLQRDRAVEMAQGQIYSGIEAKRLGLVDHLGNFYDAVEYLGNKVALGSEPYLIYYNRPKLSFVERMLGSFVKSTLPVLGRSVQQPVVEDLWLIEQSLQTPEPGNMRIEY